MNILEHLVELKLAKNIFSARHIANGLKFHELKTIEEQVERAKLYRNWRDSHIFNDTAHCYEMAIKGTPVPVEEMFKRPTEEIIRELGFETPR